MRSLFVHDQYIFLKYLKNWFKAMSIVPYLQLWDYYVRVINSICCISWLFQCNLWCWQHLLQILFRIHGKMKKASVQSYEQIIVSLIYVLGQIRERGKHEKKIIRWMEGFNLSGKVFLSFCHHWNKWIPCEATQSLSDICSAPKSTEICAHNTRGGYDNN